MVMVTRWLSICVTLAFVSVAQAGAVIELVPNNSGPYLGGETLTVEYMLSQSPDSAQHFLRLVQFDMNTSDSELELDWFHFDYSAAWCWWGPWGCSNHSRFEALHDRDGAVVSSVFMGTSTDSMDQINLPASGPIKVGALELTLPMAPGLYTLDALNAGAENVMNDGAQISFGFGGNDPITYLRATEGNVTGGQYVFEVIPEPATLALLALGGLAVLRRRVA